MKKKWLVIGISLLSLGTWLIPATAHSTGSLSASRGSWLYVGGSGQGNYTKIQDAINATTPGDTVFIYDDSSPYYETLLINKSIVVRGENWNTTIINGSGCQRLIILGASSITIQDLSFQDCRTAVETTGSDVETILHNNFNGMTGDGVQFWWSHQNIIANNCFKGIQGHAIYVVGGSNETIVGNILDGNAYGIVTDSYSVIRENIVKNTSGFSLTCSDDTLVENNLFVNNSGVYFGYTTENNIVRNNTLIQDGFFVDRNLLQLSNNTVNGKPIIYAYKPSDQVFDQPAGQIIVVYGHNCIVRNLNLSDTAYGLVLSGYGCTVENITCYNDNAYGLSVWGSDNIIKNCKVTHSGNGIDLRCTRQSMTNCRITNVRKIGIWAFSDDSRLSHCTVTDAGQIGIYAAGEGILIDHCSIKNATQQGISVYVANGMIIDHCIIENTTDYGILLNGTNNKISNNSLKNTHLAVSWNGFCSVEHNDFIGNEQSAKFHLEHGHRFKTQWVDNYWEEPQSKPKIILGKADILLFSFMYSDVVLTLPFFGIDFSPAQAPHTSQL